jgi:hypothetical protein
MAAAGTVVGVYPNGRDRVMLPFPCIEVACGTVGAMSGGVVLDEHGLLMGVLSIGLSVDDGQGPSYAAWIIKALKLPVDVPWPPGAYRQRTRVLDLPANGCHIVGRDAMIDAKDSTSYRIWFDAPPDLSSG